MSSLTQCTRLSAHSKLFWTLGVALASLIVSPSLAHAEASASDRATARSLAVEGYSALKNKDYVTAEDRFRRADELVHAPTLVLDHARALVGLGRFGEAYAAYDSVAHEQIPPGSPAVWKRAAADAQRELETVKPKVGFLIVRVKGASDPNVEIDGRPLPLQSLGERLPETAGQLRVVVSATGFVTQNIDQSVAVAEEKTLEVELLPVPVPPPVVVVAPAAPLAPHVDTALEDRRQHRRTLAYVAFGASGLGIAVGAATGILWLKARSDVKSACGGLACDPQNSAEQARFESDKHRYDTFGTLSGVGFGVGLVGAATGAVLLLTQPSEPEGEAQHAAIRPYVGPGSFGVYGAFQ